MSNQRASLPVSSTSSSSSSTPQRKYDVFLSFRGDTRNKFTDHLYTALDDRGIMVFRDDENLAKGKTIGPELLKAIAESRFSIVVLSRNYASSRWCLDELVQIVECMREKTQVVLPVFYDVTPSEVRKQTGSFLEDFAKHEEKFRENIKKVEEWRTAMTEVGNLDGWHLQDRSEAKLIQNIVKYILCKLSHALPSVVDGLVGIDSRVKKLNSCLGEGLKDVRFIGICGMGGIGKTTIAKVVYERLSHQFEGSCFLENVKEVVKKLGLISLQNQLLSKVLIEPNINALNVYGGDFTIRNRLQYKKVLIILDDVDRSEQLNMLAGDHGWFGPGSRIIITTRDEHLLRAHGVDGTYKAKELDDDESLTLFSRKAFKLYHPAKDYEELSKRVINYANGLPLALEVLGSFLYGRSVDVWKSALDRLDKNPNRDILNTLQVSFDGLEELEKKIFLDIACFFKGSDKDNVIRTLDACDFYAAIGIEVLIDKSLIKMSSNKLWMHDLLQIMGREIVHRECSEEPGKRSRLWTDEDVNHVLTKNMGTDIVEAIVIDLPERTEAQWNADSFSKMSKLRLLKIHNVHLSQGPKCLSNELRSLEWYGYPSKCLPFSFHLSKLVELNMCNGDIKQLWKEKEDLGNLKFVTLSHSQNLTKTPDFTGTPNLEMLILEGCTRLCEIHPSIGLLTKLNFLNLKDCENLLSLPSNINGWKSLEILDLSGCSKLKNVPENLGIVECLEELDLSGTAIRLPPSSIFLLKNLKKLYFHGCNGAPSTSLNLLSCLWLMERRIPDPKALLLPSLSGLCSLTELDLSDCSLDEGAIPNDIGCLSSLKELNLSSNNFVSLPASISQLSRLGTLYVENCNSLQSLLELPSNLISLQASACTSLEMLPDPIQGNTETPPFKGPSFRFLNCFKLTENHGCSSLATRIAKTYLQGVSNLSRGLRILIPGNEIPEWFSYQTEGCDALTMQWSPHLHDKLRGFALCCTFVAHQHSPAVDCVAFFPFYFSLLLDDGDLTVLDPFMFEDKSGQAVPDHLYLLYLPLDDDLKKASRITFSVYISWPGFEVKKFGLHPVYELSQTSSSTFENFNDLNQDFDGSALDGAVTVTSHLARRRVTDEN